MLAFWAWATDLGRQKTAQSIALHQHLPVIALALAILESQLDRHREGAM